MEEHRDPTQKELKYHTPRSIKVYNVDSKVHLHAKNNCHCLGLVCACQLSTI